MGWFKKLKEKIKILENKDLMYELEKQEKMLKEKEEKINNIVSKHGWLFFGNLYKKDTGLPIEVKKEIVGYNYLGEAIYKATKYKRYYGLTISSYGCPFTSELEFEIVKYLEKIDNKELVFEKYTDRWVNGQLKNKHYHYIAEYGRIYFSVRIIEEEVSE